MRRHEFVQSKKTILICDDSPVVHKAVMKYLGDAEALTLLNAENGEQAIECMKQHKVDVLFLDLTMPVMDGFEVLQTLPVNPYPTKIIILSADVQKQAMERCIQNGATFFLPKPFNQAILVKALERVGITLAFPQASYSETASTQNVSLQTESLQTEVHQTDSPETNSYVHQNSHPNALSAAASSSTSAIASTQPDRNHVGQDDFLTVFKEVANVALGRGAAIISDHFGEFIKMPMPNVAMLSTGELAMAILDIKQQAQSKAIAQRFVGGGIHGEALVCLHGQDIKAFGYRLGFGQKDEFKSEVVMDIANLMVSSFLVSLSEQMNIPFSVRQPVVMEDYMVWGEGKRDQRELFTVEYCYQSENLDVECNVLFMMDHNSTEVIKRVMETLH